MDRYTDTTNDRRAQDWRTKGSRFVRYVSTRPAECWGFFAAGIVIAKIFL